jgi:hypothetical protein
MTIVALDAQWFSTDLIESKALALGVLESEAQASVFLKEI